MNRGQPRYAVTVRIALQSIWLGIYYTARTHKTQAELLAYYKSADYLAYVDRCESWHAAGRAFDFAVVRHEDGEVSCRYDEWGDDAGRLRDYWRLAASLAAHFTYTLTLSYNAQHHNHIHVDNAVNGWDAPRLRERSRAQVQVVQGVVRHVFDRDCPENGSYDDATRDAVRSVQSQLGITAPLADVDGWRQFLTRAAGTLFAENGWRDHSPSDLGNGFFKIGRTLGAAIEADDQRHVVEAQPQRKFGQRD